MEVETGVGDGDYFEIVSGLQAGDTIAYMPPQTSNMYGMYMAMGGNVDVYYEEGDGPN